MASPLNDDRAAQDAASRGDIRTSSSLHTPITGERSRCIAIAEYVYRQIRVSPNTGTAREAHRQATASASDDGAHAVSTWLTVGVSEARAAIMVRPMSAGRVACHRISCTNIYADSYMQIHDADTSRRPCTSPGPCTHSLHMPPSPAAVSCGACVPSRACLCVSLDDLPSGQKPAGSPGRLPGAIFRSCAASSRSGAAFTRVRACLPGMKARSMQRGSCTSAFSRFDGCLVFRKQGSATGRPQPEIVRHLHERNAGERLRPVPLSKQRAQGDGKPNHESLRSPSFRRNDGRNVRRRTSTGTRDQGKGCSRCEGTGRETLSGDTNQ